MKMALNSVVYFTQRETIWVHLRHLTYHRIFFTAGRHDSGDRWKSYPWPRWPRSTRDRNTNWETRYVCCCCWNQPTESMSFHPLSLYMSIIHWDPWTTHMIFFPNKLIYHHFISGRYFPLCLMLEPTTKSFLIILYVSWNLNFTSSPCHLISYKLCYLNMFQRS